MTHSPSPSTGQSLPTSFSDLILPYQPSLSHTLTSLKKTRLSIPNRLRSIIEDANFVSTVSNANALPLVANERCGSWYIDLQHKEGSVYFKSTDGHQGQWAFSLRRLNLGLLEVLGRHGGAIVVDSTRRGKSMPDALSKTLPIWAAVMNRVLFPEREDSHSLCAPHDVVGVSEQAQIAARLDGFARDLKDLDLDLSKLRAALGKPIHVEFISRQSSVIKVQRSPSYHTLIGCSASRHEHSDGDHYVQGAGDDTENWAYGLTAQLFWQHKDSLLNEPNEEKLYEMIAEMSSGQQLSTRKPGIQILLKGVPTSIYVGKSSNIGPQDMTSFDGIIFCDTVCSGEALVHVKSIPRLELACPPGKLGGKALRDKLRLLEPFVVKLLNQLDGPGVLILCSTGRDLSIGVALAILCRHIHDDGTWTSEPVQDIDKGYTRRMLACIVDTIPEANPSRATLQSVNTYLMGRGP